jgi:Nucleotide-diphospho-sugar transferase
MDDMMQTAAPLPDEYAWLEGGQSYVACAFYTPNYLPQLLSLKASLEAHGVNHYFKRYDRAQSWEATTRIKAAFVRHCLDKFPGRDVLYVDADAVMREKPVFIDTVTTDLSLLFHPVKGRRHPMMRISLGTFFIRNTPGGRKFAELWASQESKAGARTCDDDMIIAVFNKLTGVTMTVLPETYYKVFDQPGEAPVFEHFQASRGEVKIRNTVRKRLQRTAWTVGALVVALLAWHFLRGA